MFFRSRDAFRNCENIHLSFFHSNLYIRGVGHTFGGVVIILLSGAVLVVYALMMTLADLGIRIVDALKSL